jgi:hypothetical protein
MKFYLLLAFLFYPLCLWSHIYPVKVKDRDGIWIGTKNGVIYTTGEIFRFYTKRDGLPTNYINDLAVDREYLWIATPKGLARLNKRTQKLNIYKTPEYLPSNNVLSVDTDPIFHEVWIGTDKGLAVYNIQKNEWKNLTKKHGLPSNQINDILVLGNTIWLGTKEGLSKYHKQTHRFTTFTTKDGLGGNNIQEIIHLGVNIFFITTTGLSRLDLHTQTFTAYKKSDGLLSYRITAFTKLEDRILIGTPKGVNIYLLAADTLLPFVHKDKLPSQRISGIEILKDYIFFSTEKGLSRFDPKTTSWRYYTREDGMSSQNIQGLASFGNNIITLFKQKLINSFNVTTEEWIERGPKKKIKPLLKKYTFGAELNTNFEYENKFPEDKRASRQGFWTLGTTKLGLGLEFEKQRTLDISGMIDYGEITQKGLNEYDFKLRYLGKQEDILREIIIHDELDILRNENSLIQKTQIEGLQTVIAIKKKNKKKNKNKDLVRIETSVGFRRGTYHREMLKRQPSLIYQLEKQFIIPGSERVWVDGVELEREIDFAITYTNGQLTILNPERINPLSQIEVEYEYELISRKYIGAYSILDLLPKDNEISGWKRDGPYRYARDEQGLYDEINGGAQQYIDRGWQKGLFQDYTDGKINLKILIHDMGDPKSAQAIFDYIQFIAPRQIENRDWMILDEGLASSYQIKMVIDQYYIEILIEDKGDRAKGYIIAFGESILYKLKTKEKYKGDLPREAIFTGEVGSFPISGLAAKIGYIHIPNPSEEKQNKAHKIGVLDISKRFNLGKHRKLEISVQKAISHKEREPSSAILYRTFLSTKKAQVKLQSRMYEKDFEGIGTSQKRGFTNTRFGNLERDANINTEVKVKKWLVLRGGWLWEESEVKVKEESGQGIRHALNTGFRLLPKGIPKLGVEFRRIKTWDPFMDDLKWQLINIMEYNLPPKVLDLIKWNKIYLRILYDWAISERERVETSSLKNRVHHIRLDLKLAPTTTESGYLILKRQDFKAIYKENEKLAEVLKDWELSAGVESSFIPGLALRFSEELTFLQEKEEDKPTDTRLSQAVLGGLAEIFPGEWFSDLAPIKLKNRYTFTQTQEAEGEAKVGQTRIHKLDVTGIWDTPGKFTAEIQGIITIKTAGQFNNMLMEKEELRNRIIYRPIYPSPIILGFDFIRLIDYPEEYIKKERLRSLRYHYNPRLEWERRWSRKLWHKLRLNFFISDAYNQLVDPERGEISDYSQWSVIPGYEIRYLIEGKEGENKFRVYSRGFYKLTFGKGLGSETSRTLSISIGYILNLAENVFLDFDLTFTNYKCIEIQRGCESYFTVKPSLIMKAHM